MTGREFLLGGRLAWQYIARGRKWTLILTIFLMSVAFVNLVFASSLLGSITRKVESQVQNLVVGDVYLEPKKYGDGIKNVKQKIEKIKQINGVKQVGHILTVYAELSDGDSSVQLPVRIIDPKTYPKIIDTPDNLLEGEFLENDYDIVLGAQITATGQDRQILRSLEKTKLGDEVDLKINGKAFQVRYSGRFKTKFINADSEALISRATWQKIVDDLQNEQRENQKSARQKSKLPPNIVNVLPKQVVDDVENSISEQSDQLLKKQQEIVDLFPGKDDSNMIIVRTEPDRRAEVLKAVEQFNFVDTTAHSWEDAAGYTKSISGSFIAVDGIMFAAGVFIASVTIFIVIYVDIINKRRQIGIQRAIGVKPSIIIFSYALLSMFYAFFGVLLGLVLFYGGLVPYFYAYPLDLPIAEVNLSVAPGQIVLRTQVVIFVALVSGIIPAIMASRMKMLDAILGKK
ncbi:hypothetical protein CSA80_00495 [Candidatus Saccharibacteria bacterium]|nr:MAG: hypothetical protein CR973_00775 [Candidatus Saccharibacteria bacterium]PID99236.1 MAG: hypothetical protein CSA80_00495 [Candidatus Saccharibacteria bacterium]